MPPPLSTRRQPAPSYSPVMHILGRPLQYFSFSFVTFSITLLCIRMTHNKPDITTLFQNSSYPIAIGIVTFNLLLSIFLCIYYLLNGIFFGALPNMTEHTIIVEKLFNFFSFKIVLVGMVIEADIYDLSQWLVWYVILASVKAILQFGLIRLNVLVESSNTNIYHYLRPSLHLLFGIFFVLNEYFFSGMSGRGNGPFGLWMLILFDLVTFTIELSQSIALHIIYFIKASSDQSNTSTANSTPLTEIIKKPVEGTSFKSFALRSSLVVLSTLSAVISKLFRLQKNFMVVWMRENLSEIFLKKERWVQNTDFEEVQYIIVLCTDILILGITLIHYFHVFMIHGLSLSLVDLLLLFNILSTGMFSSHHIVSHVNIIMLVYLVRFPFS